MRRSFLLLASCLLAISVTAIAVSVNILRHSYCGRPSGYAIAGVSGGVPPYTYSWSAGFTTEDALGLGPGSHSVTVTDSQSDQATANFTIDLLPSYGGLGVQGQYTTCAGGPGLAVVYTGMQPGFQQPPLSSAYGQNPYTFSHPLLSDDIQATICWDPDQLVHHVLGFSEPGYHIFDFEDADGCPGQMGVMISAEVPSPPMPQAVNVAPSCASTATGSITISYQGDLDFDYLVKLRQESSTDYCNGYGGVFSVPNWQASGTYTFPGLLPGDYWLISTSDALGLLGNTPYSSYICADSVLVTVPSLGTDCGLISGHVFIDDDATCIMGFGENRVPGTIVEITPGPYYVTTNSIGQYSIGLNFGSYTVTEQHPVFDQSCSGAVTLASGTQTLNVGCAGGAPLDVQLSMANGAARPGFETLYAVDLDNLTPASTGTVTLTVTLDPVLGFVSANPTPSSISGNVLTWTTPQLVMNQVFQHRDINIRTLVPPDVGLIGTTLTTTAQLTTANTDGNLANNSATSNQLVTGSFDPNDKTATTSLGSNSTWLIDEDEWIDYVIRFQNTGTDTAFNVVITDTLPGTLDPTSIIWGAASHNHNRMLEGQGVLKFIFPSILLPDSNVNEAASHGFVSFRVRPQLPITAGTVIANTANIFFDFNPPVITEPSVLVAEFSTGVVGQGQVQGEEAIHLQPNPVSDVLTVNARGSITSMRIITSDGREIMRSGANASIVTIDVSAMAAGAYMFLAELSNGTIARERFIKH